MLTAPQSTASQLTVEQLTSQISQLTTQLADFEYRKACEWICEGECDKGIQCAMNLLRLGTHMVYRPYPSIGDYNMTTEGIENSIELYKLAALNGSSVAALRVCVFAAISTKNYRDDYEYFDVIQEDATKILTTFIPILNNLGMWMLSVELGLWCLNNTYSGEWYGLHDYNRTTAIAFVQAAVKSYNRAHVGV